MNDKELEEFKEVVINWVQVDDEIRLISAKLKEMKDDKKNLEEYILETMGKMEDGVIDITDGKLRLNKSVTRSALKQEYLESALTDMIKDQTKAQEMTKLILDKRPIVEKVRLKRTFNRKKPVK
tara:strand:- start:2941 stop:3312 length:372 start_codon:yes stop_codon:yes gene_type:complete